MSLVTSRMIKAIRTKEEADQRIRERILARLTDLEAKVAKMWVHRVKKENQANSRIKYLEVAVAKLQKQEAKRELALKTQAAGK